MVRGVEEGGVMGNGQRSPLQEVIYIYICKGNLTILRRILHLDLAKGNPKRTL
jgi:hypothetical protein